jgi:hypothetical protein
MNKDYPLGLLESYYCIAHELNLDNSNAALMIELEGELDIDLFKQALRYLYEKNPLLRASYDKDSETHEFFFQWDIEFSDIEIVITDSEAPDQASGVEALEHSLGTLFKLRGPLWRVNLLRATGNKSIHYLIVGFHHAIIDGVSELNVAKSIINYYHTLLTQGSIPIQSLAKYPPVSFLFDKKLNFVTHCKNHDLFFEKYGETKELLYDNSIPLTESQTKVMLCDFDKDILERALVFARQHGVTLTSLLCATLLRAMYLVTGQEETTLQTPVNLRKYTQPELSDDIIGCYINGVKVIFRNIGAYTRLELLAQDYQRQFGDNFKIFHIPPLDFPIREFEKFFGSPAVWVRDRFLWGFGVSNWGRVTLNQDSQSLKINAIHRATGRQLADAPFYLHIATINDEIMGAFNYVVPYMSQQKMADIIQAFRSLFINVEKSW